MESETIRRRKYDERRYSVYFFFNLLGYCVLKNNLIFGKTKKSEENGRVLEKIVFWSIFFKKGWFEQIFWINGILKFLTEKSLKMLVFNKQNLRKGFQRRERRALLINKNRKKIFKVGLSWMNRKASWKKRYLINFYSSKKNDKVF